MTDFQTLVRQELADEPPPPRDIVGPAWRAGRRDRRRRHVVAVGAAVLVAAALVAVPSLPPVQAWRLGSQARATRVVPASGPMVPATPAGVLEALRFLLPPGPDAPLSGSARWFGGDQFIVTAVRGGREVTMNVSHRDGLYSVFATADECKGLADVTSTCVRTRLADGSVITFEHVEGNCTETTTVSVLRPTDTRVTLFVPSCLASTTPMPQMLTDAEAVAIAANPVFAWQMPDSLVTSGSRNFPDLPGTPQ
jgi:hypothetical protein